MMTCTNDATGRRYTLTQGEYHATVVHASTGEWVVLLDNGKKPVDQLRCATLEEAQTWTAEQLERLTSMQ